MTHASILVAVFVVVGLVVLACIGAVWLAVVLLIGGRLGSLAGRALRRAAGEENKSDKIVPRS